MLDNLEHELNLGDPELILGLKSRVITTRLLLCGS